MNGTAYYYTDSTHMEFICAREQTYYPWHMHMRHWTIGVVDSGSVILTTSTGSQHLCGGQHFFICPYEAHSLKVTPESSLLVFCFDNVAAFSTDTGVIQKFFFHNPLFQAQEKLLVKSFTEACTKTFIPDLKLLQKSLELSDSLVNLSVQAVVRQVQDDPGKFNGIAQMAAFGGYSQWHFLRAFQIYTGMTPHAFQLLCRLRMLRKLLRADMASAAAAISAGFSDQSHMHKVFKKHHSMTPGQFKQVNLLEL